MIDALEHLVHIPHLALLKALALYDMIWRRALASQMSNAVYDQLSLVLRPVGSEAHGAAEARASASALVIAGFRAVYSSGKGGGLQGAAAAARAGEEGGESDWGAGGEGGEQSAEKSEEDEEELGMELDGKLKAAKVGDVWSLSQVRAPRLQR